MKKIVLASLALAFIVLLYLISESSSSFDSAADSAGGPVLSESTTIPDLIGMYYGDIMDSDAAILPELGMMSSTTTLLSETCFDGVQNQDEGGVDCGGSSCPPCPTCLDGLLNQDEFDVDCGGVCPRCDSACFNDTDCGRFHYDTATYCGKDGHVYRDFITYKCERPGTISASCIVIRSHEFKEYCNPFTICWRGRCVDNSTLKYECFREDCCAVDYKKYCGRSVKFLPFPIRR